MDYELLFNSMIDSKEQSVVVVDKSGRIMLMVDNKHELFETDIKHAIGKNFFDVFPGIDEERSSISKVLKEKKAIINKIQSFQTYKGKKITSLTTTIPLMDNGICYGAVEILEDINEYNLLSRSIILDETIGELKDPTTKNRSNGTQYTLKDIIGESETIIELKKKIYKIADSVSPVLIYGETGTGKELVAQSIHNASFKRRKGPFIAQNCAAIPFTLLESILFGTSEGSFTGAKEKIGLFELANGGTLLLDELNSMHLDLQAKLLRVIQEKSIRRLGNDKIIPIDVRIISTTNVPPLEAIDSNVLRRDLYYRLNVIGLNIIPLRKRQADIGVLSKFFIDMYNKQYDKQVKGITKDCMAMLYDYHWPGNVRELKHTIESIIHFTESDEINQQDLPEYMRENSFEEPHSNVTDGEVDQPKRKFGSLTKDMEIYEKALIVEALDSAGGNKTKAAGLLQIPRQTLNSKIRKLGITEHYNAK
jgi:arginine utilization regulatory protein